MRVQELYVPGASFGHRLTPVTKLVAAIAALSVVFVYPWPWASACVLAALTGIAFAWGIGRKMVRIVFLGVLPYVLMLLVMQSLFHPGAGRVLLDLRWVSVKADGLRYAIETSLRILAMVAVFVVVQLVTRSADAMVDLEARGLSPKATYLVVTTLNILPSLIGKADAILDAQRSRGLETEGRLLTRARSLLSLIGPLVVGAINEVQERAIALELRGFGHGGRRTLLGRPQAQPFEGKLRLALWVLTAAGIVWRVVLWLL